VPIADGQLILVKRSNEVGGFILRNQSISPEQVDFDWFYRKDGSGRLGVTDSAVTFGTVTGATQVTFASFSVPWSMHSQGTGWVYYSAFPIYPRGPATYEMCVTSETNIAGIDAFDPKWIYRERPKANYKELLGIE
jgi:hypothetical protein